MNQVGFERQEEEQPKRISLSAGTRLSAILDNGHSDQAAKREAHRNSVRKAGLSPILAEVPENRSTRSAHSSGYTTNVWSGDEKFAAIRNNKQVQKRGGWKRILIIGLVVLILIIVLAVGLGLGLKPKKKSEYEAICPSVEILPES